jgi:hypothetical protein
MGFWAAQCAFSNNHVSGTPWDGPKESDQNTAQQDLDGHCSETGACVEDGTYCRVSYYD